MDISYLACGKCNEYLRVVSPAKDFTKEIEENGGEIDGVVVFQCPNCYEDIEGGHTRIILDLAKIVETGKVI